MKDVLNLLRCSIGADKADNSVAWSFWHRLRSDTVRKVAADAIIRPTNGGLLPAPLTAGCSVDQIPEGTIFTEAEEACVVYGIPRSVDEANLSDRSVPLFALVKALGEVI